jgi:membrane protease YdiL (CAAX protease family)
VTESKSTPSALRPVLLELTALWLVTNLLIRGVLWAEASFGLHEAVLALVPCLFIYAPVLVCHLRGVDSYDYPLWVPRLNDGRAWGQALWRAMKWFGALLVPWMIIYHLYQSVFFGNVLRPDFPAGFFQLVAFHIFFVAIPEEFFYRGYFQTRLNEVLPKNSLFGGTAYGNSLWITSLFFAFGHSLVMFQWWHFTIFFPGLLFGLLRERTGGVLAAAFLHAFCNLGVKVLEALYGVRVG